jgi:hypothetical protein
LTSKVGNSTRLQRFSNPAQNLLMKGREFHLCPKSCSRVYPQTHHPSRTLTPPTPPLMGPLLPPPPLVMSTPIHVPLPTIPCTTSLNNACISSARALHAPCIVFTQNIHVNSSINCTECYVGYCTRACKWNRKKNMSKLNASVSVRSAREQAVFPESEQ